MNFNRNIEVVKLRQLLILSFDSLSNFALPTSVVFPASKEVKGRKQLFQNPSCWALALR